MSGKITIKGARLSFPSLFKPTAFQEGSPKKYSASLMIPSSDKEQIKAIRKEIKAFATESKAKVTPDRICFVDGDASGKEAQEGYWVFRASNTRRPIVLNRDKSPLTEEDEVLYAGCYVNAIVQLWHQNNQWGQRINANLLGVQFVKDGERFGVAEVDVSEEFEDLSDSDDPGFGDDDLGGDDDDLI